MLVHYRQAQGEITRGTRATKIARPLPGCAPTEFSIAPDMAAWEAAGYSRVVSGTLTVPLIPRVDSGGPRITAVTRGGHTYSIRGDKWTGSGEHLSAARRVCGEH